MRVLTVATLGNTVFVGTTKGLYRINSGTWEKVVSGYLQSDQLFGSPLETISMSEQVSISLNWKTLKRGAAYIGQLMSSDTPNAWEIFLSSSDLGDTWTEINPYKQFIHDKNTTRH